MRTTLLSVDATAPRAELIAQAAECLRQGGLVAFPTETVYGLGVHALDRMAVLRLFAAKGRPSTDPLIVHVASVSQIADLTSEFPPMARALAAAFWPGPLTLVLPKAPIVPDEVTAGLASVALRVPRHPVAHALLARVALPIAAPSANLFSRPSPTTAQHVVADLDGRIDMVLDGGPAPVGVESSVVDLTTAVPRLLRPGGISLRQIAEVLDRDVEIVGASPEGPQPSPGLLERHYSPRAPLTLFEGDALDVQRRMMQAVDEARAQGRRVALLLVDEDLLVLGGWPDVSVRSLGPMARPDVMAASLYAALRELDATNPDEILARGVSTGPGLLAALADRLRRASAGRVVACDQARN